MAEARAEDEEERVRESRGGRNPRLTSTERAERNKPEQRLSSSQGALSSIRAAIKRTSNRTTAQPDHSRDRRRPEITILSAEPLANNSWFQGPSGAFPPPPPPPAQPSWAGSGLTVQLPPPSYEQVIREKSREQNIHSSVPSSSSSSSSSPTPRRTSVTISTQTDTDSSAPTNPTRLPSRRPPKPPRPSFPLAPKTAESASVSAQTQCLIELEESDQTSTKHAPRDPELPCRPLEEHCGVQTDFSNDLELTEATPTLTDSAHITSEPASHQQVRVEVSARPRPRPRSKVLPPPVIREVDLDEPMTREVKVQTLVRLKDDSAESIFAGFTDSSSDVSSNKYLQELLDVFGFEEQDFKDDQPCESDQSEQSEEEEASSKSCVSSSVPSEPLVPLKRPEPRPRTYNPKPAVVPKPSEPKQDVQTPEDSPDKNKQPMNPPVPAPRPLLTNKLSVESKEEKNRVPRPARPPVAARRSVVVTQIDEAPSGHQTSAVILKPSVDDQGVDDQARNSSTAPGMPSTNRGSEKCSLDSTPAQHPPRPPFQRRPPPPSYPSAQAAVGAANVPSLPPRPSEGKLLPLRPPPIKLPKSAGSSSQPPAAANKLPAHRVPKRGPPLPPRPKPGHPLYRDNTSKVPQGSTKMNLPGTESEEHYLQKEELLLVLDETHSPTQTASLSEEVKVQAVGDDPAVRDECVSEEKVKKEEQQHQPNADIRYEARFAFEGQEDELTFREGDVITLLEYVNEEWGRGCLNGRTGLFPLNFVQDVPSAQDKPTSESPASSVCVAETQMGRALFDFTPEAEDELCLKVGDVVSCLEEMDDEWFVGEFAGKRGIVPRNYIQVL